ncbi:SDR family oxidoreductase [Streptomyces sp. NPDC051018]|uniref:SDR family oxidoreductase n=1 Tax=Streptomyces sp. NPDC051018 TaxID=3365639 RepID=UPI0037BA534F
METTRTPRPTPGDSAWFTRARFGMFIHWGLYAMAARDFSAQRADGLTAAEYEARYFTRFDPDLYDPGAWADAAAGAGMKYMVAVAKHHEGFCLWDSALTDYTAVKSPAGRDLLAPLLGAFRDRGLRTGLYYSLIDWRHPDFTVDWVHPQSAGDRAALNAGRDMARYREYARGQIRELLTRYGPLDIMWPDYSYDAAAWHRMASRPENVEAAQIAARAAGRDFDLAKDPGKGAADWDAAGLLAMIRELAPGILVNDRLGLADGYDITTPEQTVPASWPLVDGEPALWETCQTFAGSWGYHRDTSARKSVEQLVVMLVDTVSKGGNLLHLCARAAVAAMKPHGFGRVVLIGSVAAQTGGSVAAGPAYVSAKAGVMGLTRALARMAGPSGVTVNCVCPGVIDTPMTADVDPEVKRAFAEQTPLRRNGTPEDVASVIVMLASQGAGFVTGAHIDVNGGLVMT